MNSWQAINIIVEMENKWITIEWDVAKSYERVGE